MSLIDNQKLEAKCSPTGDRDKAKRVIFPPNPKDLGNNFQVNRMLPRLKEGRKLVGPFIFWDHMGPVKIQSPDQLAVRPHPHIGLATLTFLFEGQIMHKDSLGFEQPIRPGEVNWMVAGKGIVHSERTESIANLVGQSLHGIQSWIALPLEHEDVEPSFHHHKASELPKVESQGVEFTLIAGSALQKVSPVKTHSDLFYLFAQLKAETQVHLPAEKQREAAVYSPEASIEVGGRDVAAKSLVLFEPGEPIEFKMLEPGPIIIFGGEPLGEDRHIWWNFVSSSKEKIELAKQRWKNQEFERVEGDDEFIPLPEN